MSILDEKWCSLDIPFFSGRDKDNARLELAALAPRMAKLLIAFDSYMSTGYGNARGPDGRNRYALEWHQLCDEIRKIVGK